MPAAFALLQLSGLALLWVSCCPASSCLTNFECNDGLLALRTLVNRNLDATVGIPDAVKVGILLDYCNTQGSCARMFHRLRAPCLNVAVLQQMV